MKNNKIIRSVCYFTDKPSSHTTKKIESIIKKLNDKNYIIQTKRICCQNLSIKELDKLFDKYVYLSVGTLNKSNALQQLNDFFKAKNVAFNLDLSKNNITEADTEILLKIIKNYPNKTFSFAYVFNNVHSSPFYPSASYHKNGFSIGLQPTDLSENCKSIDEWLIKLKFAWNEIAKIFKTNKDFLGIDSSITPLFHGKSSFVNFIKKIGLDFSKSVTSHTYVKISNFIKENNPKPIGLCGFMFPCLEDFELAAEYEKGNFSIERNIYLSLHSGLGIDTYPIGIDEKPKRIIEILSLLQGLSNKYKKPLSARFVSDGKARIGQKTNFKNQYLKDVIVRKL